MPSDATNQSTRREWRELGFFYDRDDQAKMWQLTGSRAGLLRFRDVLRSYAADPRNELKSEHEHYGPYGYLEVMTWPEPGFDDHAIRGSLADIARLATVIENKLAAALPGSTIRIQEEFAEDSAYGLILEVKEDGFDPASADQALPAEDAR
jgi:hypothetical protein